MNTAILVVRPAAAPAPVPDGTGDLVRLFALDRLHARHRLVCHWHRGADGRLSAVWEHDLTTAPRR